MKRKALLVIGMFLFVSLFGCKKNTAPTKKNPTKKRQAASVPAKKAPETRKMAAKTMTKSWLVNKYEVVRLALAADDLGKSKSGSASLETEVKGHESKAKGKDKAVFAALLASSAKLSKVKDFKAARLAFGEVSKQVITYLHAHPDHAKGITAYTCPMAKGYKKWIQADANMANPYMGKKMLKCGGKTKLVP